MPRPVGDIPDFPDSEEPLDLDRSADDGYREENIERTEIWTLADQREHTISFHVDPDLDVTLHGDGRVEYNHPPDEAAAAFWQSVRSFAQHNGIRFQQVIGTGSSVTLGEVREMIDGMPDTADVTVLVPADGEEWRSVGEIDIQASPSELQVIVQGLVDRCPLHTPRHGPHHSTDCHYYDEEAEQGTDPAHELRILLHDIERYPYMSARVQDQIAVCRRALDA